MNNKRVELKYLVPRMKMLNFLNALADQGVLQVDPYADPDTGQYTIESLYYDTPYDDCLNDSIEGYPLRKKIRLRHYRDKNYHVISKNNLEQKIKFVQYSHKLRQEYIGEVKDSLMDYPIASFDMNGPFISKTVIEYERYPFIIVGEQEGRVTLDIDIRSKLPADFGQTFRGNVFLHQDYGVLEIKGSNPQAVRTFHSFISKYIPTQSTRFSKYCLGVLALFPNEHVDYWSNYQDFLIKDIYSNLSEDIQAIKPRI